MNIQNKLSLLGGVLVILSIFLPAVSFLGTSVSLWQTNKGVAIFYLLCGAIITGSGLNTSKTFYTTAFVLSILTFLLSLKYWADAGSMAGIGIYTLLIGSALSIYASWQGRK